MSADNITVLRCHDNVRLAKLITRKGDGELEVKGFDDARTFAWRQVTVSGLDDIQLMLEQLRGDPKSCVIRGEPREGVGARAIVNRRQHIGSDGSEPHWKHHPTGRRWLAFDLDKVGQDAFSDGVPSEEQVRAIVYQVRAEVLPPAFTRAACVYKLSSSAGLYGWNKVSMHLWFWLDRPVHDLSLREYFKAGGFDISFSKAVQPHYTADPVFEGMTDPLAGVRLGRLPGRPVVEVPPELIDGDTWRQRDLERREAAKRDIERRVKAVTADIPPSRAATRAYALRALQGACGDVLGAAEGTRHDQLIRSAYKLGGYCQPGFLDVGEVVQALTRTVEAVFPAGRQRDELRTVTEMVEGGARNPLDLGHIGRKAPARLSVVRNEEPPEDDDDDALEVVGATAVMPARKGKARGIKWALVDRDGKPENVSENVEALLDFMGVTLRRNLMNHSTEWGGELTKSIPTSAMNAVMLANIIDEGQRRGFTKTQHLQAYLDKIEVKHAYHPVSQWALSAPWDGVDRVPMLLDTLGISSKLMTEHGPLLHEQLLRWLIAGGKMLVSDTGIAAEGVLVLQGPQGTGKTRWVKALLGPNPNWVAEGVILDPADKDSVILATSTFIAELGELDATYRKSDIAALKAFLTRDKDIYRSPYAKRSETYPRRTIFAATVNPSQFLADDTGNRRFWVMPVGNCRSLDPSAYQQAWAQAIALGRRGERHWLDDESRRDAERLLERFRDISPWEDLFFECYYPPGPDTDAVERATRFALIRDTMRPDKSWTTADVKQFGKWLRSRYKSANHNGSAAFYVRRRD